MKKKIILNLFSVLLLLFFIYVILFYLFILNLCVFYLPELCFFVNMYYLNDLFVYSDDILKGLYYNDDNNVDDNTNINCTNNNTNHGQVSGISVNNNQDNNPSNNFFNKGSLNISKIYNKSKKRLYWHLWEQYKNKYNSYKDFIESINGDTKLREEFFNDMRSVKDVFKGKYEKIQHQKRIIVYFYTRRSRERNRNRGS